MHSGKMTQPPAHQADRRSCVLCSAPLFTDAMELCAPCSSQLQSQRLHFDPLRTPNGVKYKKTATGFTVRVAMPVVNPSVLLGIAAVWCAFGFYLIFGMKVSAGGGAMESLRDLVWPLTGGTAVMGALMLVHFGGQLVIRRDGDDASIFRGVGPLGSRQSFLWSDVGLVDEKQVQTKTLLVIHAQRPLEFGTELPNECRSYLLNLLRAEHMRSEYLRS